MLRTNSKKYKSNIYGAILENVTDDLLNASEDQKLDFIFNDIQRNANYLNNVKRYPNTQERIGNYLAGLPYNFLCYQPTKILQFAEEMLEAKIENSKKQRLIINNYYNFMALQIMKMMEDKTKKTLHYIL